MSTKSPVSSPSWFTWSAPGSPIQVRIALLAVHGLQRQLERPPDSDAASMPLCGFLTGDWSRPGITDITGFQPVIDLSPPAVQDAMRRSGGKLIGFYRTTPAGSLSLSLDDLLLAKSFFHHPRSAILLIESIPSGTANGAFFVWRDGRINSDVPLIPFPFDAYRLAALEQNGLPELDQEDVYPQRVARRAVPEWWGIPGKTLKSLIPVIVLAGIALFYLARRSSEPVLPGELLSPLAQPAVPAGGRKATLALTAERRGTDLLLSWDRESPAIASAITGSLFIQAGNDHRDLVLTPEQLRSGSVFYTPTGDQIDIRLQVVGRNDSVTYDSVIVLLPPGVDQRPVVVSRPAPPPATQNSSASAPVPSAAPELQPQPNPVEPRRSFSTPPGPTIARSSAPPRLDEPPPDVSLTPKAPSPSSLFNVQPAAPPAPAVPAPTPAAPSQPPVSTQRKTAPGPQSPVPISQPLPRFSSELRAVIFNPVTVQVKVTIDAGGKVVKAEALPRNDVHVLLLQAAADAARNWKFRPATINGLPVPGEAIVSFVFSRAR